MAESIKTPVVFRKDYIMYLEFFDNLLWFHTDVYKWSKTIKQEYLKDLKALKEVTGLSLVALVDRDNTKLARFGDTTGWIKDSEIVLNNGNKADIYIWSN